MNLKLLYGVLATIIFATVAAACTIPSEIAPTAPKPATSVPEPGAYSEIVDGYLAAVPAVLRAGRTENVSVSLFDGAEPARGDVRLVLLQGSSPIAEASASVAGAGAIPLSVPTMPAGHRAIHYTLHIEGGGDADGPAFTDTAMVLVKEPAELLFLETDKPIYKPGQRIRIRALRLDADLKPLPGSMTLQIQDAKGIKVYKRTVNADEFGMAEAGLPLSMEPNLGVWKITANSGEQSAQLDVRVDEYVLPKYEISVDLPKDWVLVDEPIAGAVSAEYSFGKPVRGELEIVASRYVGTWEEYARFEGEIDGATSFELPTAGYVAGVPTSGGQGNVQLHITVREPATGYEERITKLLTVAEAPVNLQLIPESRIFKPGLPLSLLVVSETPDQRPVAADVNVSVRYVDGEFETVSEAFHDLAIDEGGALLELVPPNGAVALTVTAPSPNAEATLVMEAGHSPSGNFIHVGQTGDAALSVGALATFRVSSTTEARQFYYEVIGRNGVIFSDIAWTPDITFEVTPAMAPTARLLVYQVLPDNEVAADHIPFSASASYPMPLEVGFSSDEVRPGDAVDISVRTEGPAKVGLAAVDRSVFVLAENRLNLQQVFAELERLYAQPQAEIHLEWLPERVETRGAAETFHAAGLMTMSDKVLPAGLEFHQPWPEPSRGGDWQLLAVVGFIAFVVVAFVLGMIGLIVFGIVKLTRAVFTGLLLIAIVAATGGLVACGGSEEAPAAYPEAAAPASASVAAEAADGLAEVQRVRQFFPETWLWADVMTDAEGNATLPATAPDSITTWNLRAVGVSPEHGLGIANAELTVFQPFFLQVGLPYSAIRGEEFPVKVALYNYLDTPQEFRVEIEESGDFALLGNPTQTVTVAPNEVGGVEFDIGLTELGSLPIQVTARSREAADAVIRNLLVEPEGVAQEVVDNAILAPGDRIDFDLAAPPDAIPGSDRAYVALTGSYLAQTLDGLDNLLQMPYGCGEQNMILFAPNIYVARYLDATGQLKPEVMAKAEHLMTTGYQRELTYQRGDGSFSAFGESDDEGSLWLTAFVLKSFAQADGLIYIDEAVLRDAADWILAHQRSDGSFEPVGFLHHQELLGGLQGNTALTAYVAIALHEAGYDRELSASIAYLGSRLDDIDDAYTMAIVAYALELAGNPRAGDANRALLDMAVADDDGLHWDSPAAMETTGYALLALLERKDAINASRAARWLAAQRNAFGGYGSTQDTVVGLQALIEHAAQARFDVDMVDMTVTLHAADWNREVAINAKNADVVQIVELPDGADLRISAAGSGRVVAQMVQRFNMPAVDRPAVEMFQIDVEYSADHVAVDDLIEVTARFAFTPPEVLGSAPDAGMVVLDVAIPTGFAPVTETVEVLVNDYERVKRYEVAGRKVILYLEDLSPGEELELRFDARARYPVRAQPVTSQAYSYYTPHWRAETLGTSVTVSF